MRVGLDVTLTCCLPRLSGVFDSNNKVLRTEELSSMHEYGTSCELAPGEQLAEAKAFDQPIHCKLQLCKFTGGHVSTPARFGNTRACRSSSAILDAHFSFRTSERSGRKS